MEHNSSSWKASGVRKTTLMESLRLHLNGLGLPVRAIFDVMFAASVL
jgi:molybdopterin-guanine dinucleotide biosynthesis protein